MDDKAFPPEEVGIDGKLLIPVEDNGAGNPTARRQTRLQERESAEEKGKEMTATLTRKALAVLMAIALALGFVAIPNGQALAAGESATLTVKGHAEFVGKHANAVKMFDAKVNGEDVEYTLDKAWKDFFKAIPGAGMESLEDAALSEAAAAYVLGLGADDEAAVTEFAADAKAYVLKNSGSFAIKQSDVAVATADGAQAQITGLDYGYYLVYPDAGSTSPDRHTDATLVNVLESATTWNIKSAYPTVDKSITGIETPEKEEGSQGGGLGVDVDDSWDGNHNMGLGALAPGGNAASANVGDILSFRLDTAVPDMTGYETYTFKLHDTLSKGLALVQKPAESFVQVQIGGTTLVQGTDFTVSVPGENGASLTIDLSSYLTKNKGSLDAGSLIVVTYKAQLNDQAAVVDPNTNEANVEYTTTPGQTEKGTPSKTYTYTFGFTIDKRAEVATGSPVEGAEFKIYADTNGDGSYTEGTDLALTFSEGRDDNMGKYMYDISGDLETVKTPTGGTLNFCGFAEGTYFVEEVSVPDPYNKMKGMITVKIEAAYNEDGTLNSNASNGGFADGHKISYKMPTDSEWTVVGHPTHTIVVVNKSGAQLPTTGGVGTVGLTIAGVVVVAAGVALVLRRNRKDDRI